MRYISTEQQAPYISREACTVHQYRAACTVRQYRSAGTVHKCSVAGTVHEAGGRTRVYKRPVPLAEVTLASRPSGEARIRSSVSGVINNKKTNNRYQISAS